MEKHTVIQDKHGKSYSLQFGDSSDNQEDWIEFKKLCAKCFLNDSWYTDVFPDPKTRTRFVKTLFDWEFSYGLDAEGDGTLMTVKVKELKNREVKLRIVAGCIAIPRAKYGDMRDLTALKLPRAVLSRFERRLRWETRVLDEILDLANKYGTTLWYYLYQLADPDFQGTGMAKKYLKKLAENLAAKADMETKSSEMPAIKVAICTNIKTLNFSMSYGISSIVGHLHYPREDGRIVCQEKDPSFKGQCCYYLLLVNPCSRSVIEAFKERFKTKSNLENNIILTHFL